jgi:hypothetical protein
MTDGLPEDEAKFLRSLVGREVMARVGADHRPQVEARDDVARVDHFLTLDWSDVSIA